MQSFSRELTGSSEMFVYCVILHKETKCIIDKYTDYLHIIIIFCLSLDMIFIIFFLKGV